MAEGMQTDWRDLCTAVVNETDFNKLSFLVQKLVEALDKRRQNTHLPDRTVRRESGVRLRTSTGAGVRISTSVHLL